MRYLHFWCFFSAVDGSGCFWWSGHCLETSGEQPSRHGTVASVLCRYEPSSSFSNNAVLLISRDPFLAILIVMSAVLGRR